MVTQRLTFDNAQQLATDYHCPDCAVVLDRTGRNPQTAPCSDVTRGIVVCKMCSRRITEAQIQELLHRG